MAAARKPFDGKIRTLEKGVQEMQAHVALSEGKAKDALALFKKAGGLDVGFLARVQLAAGEGDAAEKSLRDHANRKVNEVQPLANLAALLWKREKKDEAIKVFEQLRGSSGSIDLASVVFQRLSPIAEELKLPTDWRKELPIKADFGERPELDDLGPFRWRPYRAPGWKLPGSTDRKVELKNYRGKPVVVIFYLGYGCLHCVEQLQAFAPKAKEFREAGVEVVAISSDSEEDLAKSVEKYKQDGEFPFPLVADSKLKVFKEYRCFDDFEKLALHGTFLVDEAGMVRWQDISYEPFMNVDFVLKEARRLLAQSPVKQVAGGAK